MGSQRAGHDWVTHTFIFLAEGPLRFPVSASAAACVASPWYCLGNLEGYRRGWWKVGRGEALAMREIKALGPGERWAHCLLSWEMGGRTRAVVREGLMSWSTPRVCWFSSVSSFFHPFIPSSIFSFIHFIHPANASTYVLFFIFIFPFIFIIWRLITLCVGEGDGNPLHCSCLENPRDGVTQSRTWPKWLSNYFTIL